VVGCPGEGVTDNGQYGVHAAGTQDSGREEAIVEELLAPSAHLGATGRGSSGLGNGFSGVALSPYESPAFQAKEA
jgi:hypothetical protein